MSSEQIEHTIEDVNDMFNEITERDMIQAMFIATAERTENVDKFSSWLLAGTGATASLMITMIDSIINHITYSGFIFALTLLTGSLIFGLMAKYRALLGAIQVESRKSIDDKIKLILKKHKIKKKELEEIAGMQGAYLHKDIDVRKIFSEYSTPFPWYAQIFLWRYVKQYDGIKEYHQTLHPAVKNLVSQAEWTFLQFIALLGFIFSIIYSVGVIHS